MDWIRINQENEDSIEVISNNNNDDDIVAIFDNSIVKISQILKATTSKVDKDTYKKTKIASLKELAAKVLLANRAEDTNEFFIYVVWLFDLNDFELALTQGVNAYIQGVNHHQKFKNTFLAQLCDKVADNKLSLLNNENINKNIKLLYDFAKNKDINDIPKSKIIKEYLFIDYKNLSQTKCEELIDKIKKFNPKTSLKKWIKENFKNCGENLRVLSDSHFPKNVDVKDNDVNNSRGE